MKSFTVLNSNSFKPENMEQLNVLIFDITKFVPMNNYNLKENAIVVNILSELFSEPSQMHFLLNLLATTFFSFMKWKMESEDKNFKLIFKLLK